MGSCLREGGGGAGSEGVIVCVATLDFTMEGMKREQGSQPRGEGGEKIFRSHMVSSSWWAAQKMFRKSHIKPQLVACGKKKKKQLRKLEREAKCT